MKVCGAWDEMQVATRSVVSTAEKSHVAARQGFPDAHDVRLHSGMFPGKQFSRPSEAGGYFVKNEQQAVCLAQLGRLA